jgi:hypothetical protein
MGTVYHISTDLQRHTATNKPWSEGISVTYTRRSETLRDAAAHVSHADDGDILDFD